MVKQTSTNKLLEFSIVIIVKNDRGIENTLRELQPLIQDKPNWEVLVVDASAPATLRDIRKSYPWAKWTMFKNTSGKRFTIPEQRNEAWRKATGSIIVFMDANCIPAADWIDEIEHAFVDEGREMIAGIVKSIGQDTAHDVGYEARADNAPLNECGAANLAMKKEILEELNGFDTNLSYGEDVDLTWRAIKKGYTIIFKKDVVIYHDWGHFNEDLRRAFRYGTSRINLYKKHPDHWRSLFAEDQPVIIYPLYIIFLPLTFWFQFYPLIILVPLAKNLKKKPLQTTLSHLVHGCGVIKGIFKNV